METGVIDAPLREVRAARRLVEAPPPGRAGPLSTDDLAAVGVSDRGRNASQTAFRTHKVRGRRSAAGRLPRERDVFQDVFSGVGHCAARARARGQAYASC